MDLLYLILKYLHVLFAIVAVGLNATYGVWLARASRDPDHLAFALRGVKFLDDRMANPAYGLLLLSGLAMVWVGQLDVRAFWIGASLALWVVAIGVAAGVYTPLLKNQIAAIEKAGPDSPEYRSLSSRSTRVGLLLMVVVLLIVFMMVVKPVL